MTSATVRHGCLATLLLLLAAPAGAQLRPKTAETGVIRVCADPDNLPMSNDKGEGLENRIAELLGRTWNSKVEYAWWPVRRGFFSRGLNGRYCDIAITAPSLLDMAGTTKAYFRTGYVIVTRQDAGLDINGLDDPRLKSLRIGVHLLNADAENTPPAMAMSYHGVVGNLVGFPTFYSVADGARIRPEDIITAVANKSIDLAVVWGPLAGYFARQSTVPLRVVPVAEDALSGLPFAFDISMATRRRDRALRDSLQVFLDTKRGEIRQILEQFGVPIFPPPADSAKKVGLVSPAR